MAAAARMPLNHSAGVGYMPPRLLPRLSSLPVCHEPAPKVWQRELWPLPLDVPAPTANPLSPSRVNSLEWAHARVPARISARVISLATCLALYALPPSSHYLSIITYHTLCCGILAARGAGGRPTRVDHSVAGWFAQEKPRLPLPAIFPLPLVELVGKPAGDHLV